MSYHAKEQLERLAAVLAVVVEELDDAICHNVNATAADSAGWGQEDYDRWDAARDLGRKVLADLAEGESAQ